MWDREIILPAQCHQWYRCRTGSRSDRAYPRYRRYPDYRVHATPGEEMNRWEWIREEATSTESLATCPEALRDTKTR
jgi:hypothetical protein